MIAQRKLVASLGRAALSVSRSFSAGTPEAKEAIIGELLRSQLGATRVDVQDISGGCGAMFAIEVESPKFVGVNRVKQHRMVNDILKEEIKDMHGLTIKTKPSNA